MAGTPNVPTPSEFAKLRKALMAPSQSPRLKGLSVHPTAAEFAKVRKALQSPANAKSTSKTPLTGRSPAAQFVQLRKSLKAPSHAPVITQAPAFKPKPKVK
jgi:hypothetical protein